MPIDDIELAQAPHSVIDRSEISLNPGIIPAT